MKLPAVLFYSMFTVFMLLSILAICAFLPNFSNALNAHIEASSHTDISVLVVALITFIAAAATLFVSWRIKEEATEIGNRATEIGNSIISNSTIQRFVDRMHYEYSDLIEKTYKSIKDEPALAEKQDDAFHLSGSLASWEWLKTRMKLKQSSKIFEEFINDLMPGELGRKYKDLLGIPRVIKVINENLIRNQSVTDLMDKISEEKDDQKRRELEDELANEVKRKFLTVGMAVHLLMLALGWVPQNEATKRFDLLSVSYDLEKWTPSLRH